MANIPLKSIKFPDLADTYTVPSNAGELPYNKNATYPADTVGKALRDKPDADGTVANAEQLTSNIYEEDSVPYNFRTSGGSIDIGDRETDMLVGGTVAWNQLVNGDFSGSSWSAQGAFTLSVSNKVVTLKVNDDITSMWHGLTHSALNLETNHKVLLTVDVLAPINGTGIGCTGTSPAGGFNRIWQGIANSWTKISIITNVTGGETIRPQAYAGSNCANLNVDDEIKLKNFMTIDLTQMFGSTIADYIYSLEQATAGAGVAWFRKLFPKPYYAYNAGELMSVQASSHDMVGFNQWDEEWELGIWDSNGEKDTAATTAFRSKNYISVLPSTTYYLNIPYRIIVRTYDANKTFIGTETADSSKTITTASNCYYITFCTFTSDNHTTYNHDICINLSWDGERDGEYEAYVKHSYPLDSSLTLRGIPKLDANNNLYYDGDTYESDGTVTRKYGVVDLGTLNYTYNPSYGFITQGLSSVIKNASGYTENGNLICSKYITYNYNDITAGTTDKCIGVSGGNYGYVVISDSLYTNAETFKTAMSGVYLVYELATPTTEEADPYQNPQIVDDFGTEEYIDYGVSQGDRDVSIPVGHETQYMANLKAKLEMSPNSPEGAGDYIVRQTNGENEYVTLASNATIQDIIARLEALENAES